MAEPIARTAHGDAPLSAAHKPDVQALSGEGWDVRAGDKVVGRTVTINRPRQELYDFWKEPRNLSAFMHSVRSVTSLDEGRSHWIIEAPGGRTVESDAEIPGDQPGRLLAWRSLEGADIRHGGRVEFRDSPDHRGTCVTVTVTYDPPGGSVGQLVARLFQKEPKLQAQQELRRFKQLMETGEVATARPPDAAPRA